MPKTQFPHWVNSLNPGLESSLTRKTTASTIIQGIGAAQGIAIGRAIILDRRRVHTPKAHIATNNVQAEIARLQSAVSASVLQLKSLRERVSLVHGGEHIQILEAHELMLQDDMLLTFAEEQIAEQEINAEWALMKALENIKKFFNELDNEYFRERRSDVEFVGEHILRNLTGQHSKTLADLIAQSTKDSILVSHTLSPSETIQLHNSQIVGFCMVAGTKTAHTSIVARSLEIPAVVGAVGLHQNVGVGDQLLLNGDTGEIIVSPSTKQIETHKRRHRRIVRVTRKLKTPMLDEPIVTEDGFEVQLSSNIDLIEEFTEQRALAGQGVGLFRTEYLYLNRSTLPTEEEQFDTYSEVLRRASPYPVTIRTLDLGGDKLDIPTTVRDQLNPFFGLRAIRYCLKEKSLFITQLRALMRASVHGQLRILIPFITDVTEIRQVKILIEEVKETLTKEGIPYNTNVELGAMVEIPSAACISDLLAREVEFFSVGTNDLIQYTLAISRESTDLQYLYHPLHPAMLRMLRWVSDAAHHEGIRLAMCGEMAAEPLYSVVLLGFRFHELSMSPSTIPIVREIVNRTNLLDARELVDGLFQYATHTEVEQAVLQYMWRNFRDLRAVLGGDIDPK
jgi:phosphotransferase system enzyme I (PtsI)